MRVHVMSDIHFEHMQKEEGDHFFKQHEALRARDPADLLILAGDICQIGRHESFWRARLAQLISGYEKALYVPGNHEYYNYSFLEGDKFFENIDGNPNFHNFIQLDHGPFEFRGQRFVGNTMWFPDTGADAWAKRSMSDFYVIGTGASPFEPLVYQRHEEFRLKVVANLRAGDVVVTHHGPLPQSISARFQGSPLNPFFATDLSASLYEGRLPKLWIQGHTHDPLDYEHQVGSEKMRVYCNPHGYPHEGVNSRFWDRIAIDI